MRGRYQISFISSECNTPPQVWISFRAVESPSLSDGLDHPIDVVVFSRQRAATICSTCLMKETFCYAAWTQTRNAIQHSKAYANQNGTQCIISPPSHCLTASHAERQARWRRRPCQPLASLATSCNREISWEALNMPQGEGSVILLSSLSLDCCPSEVCGLNGAR